jgi:hypothetical protein
MNAYFLRIRIGLRFYDFIVPIRSTKSIAYRELHEGLVACFNHHIKELANDADGAAHLFLRRLGKPLLKVCRQEVMCMRMEETEYEDPLEPNHDATEVEELTSSDGGPICLRGNIAQSMTRILTRLITENCKPVEVES